MPALMFDHFEGHLGVYLNDKHTLRLAKSSSKDLRFAKGR
jgi:hypothetical protein